jgi:HlyD family secretion protein
MRWRRNLGLAATALAVAAGLAWGFWPRPVLVDGVAVARAPMTVTVEEEGRTRIKDRYVVSAPVAGFLRRIELEVGDKVSKGQVVATLEPTPSDVLDPRRRAQAESQVAAARASLKMAEEAVTAARAQAEYAHIELTRKKRLRRDNGVSQDEVDQAASVDRQNAANLRSARFAVGVAHHNLESALTALKYAAATDADPGQSVDVRSPVDADVLKRYRESEGVVAAGESLLEVGDPAALEVEVDLLSPDAVRVHPGTRVLLDRWGGEGLLDAVVRTVEPVGFTKISALGVEEQRVWVIADLTSPRERWSRLGDAYRVEASFILWHEDQVLQLPTSALFHHGDAWAVFVVEDDRAVRRPVEIGQRSGLIAQVVSGLSEGDVVITHPDDRIEDGVRVSVRDKR